LTPSQLSSTYQPLDADLTSIAALTGSSGFLKTNGAGTWSVDTVTYVPTGQGVPTGGTTGQILAKNSGTNYDTIWTDTAPTALYTSVVKHTVKNSTTSLTKGTPVYVSSSNGTNMIVSASSNASELASSKTMGLLAQDLSSNGQGFVVAEGILSGLDTYSATAGDPVWLGVDGALIYGLTNKPVAPAHLVFIGIVTRAHATQGEIFIKVQNGFELQELHNVLIGSGYSSTPSDKDLFAYESSTSLWKNKSFSTLGLATLSSPTFTGTPAAPTATAGTNTTQIATTAFVSTAVANLVASAPSTLDTLNELAAALGNDASFASTVTTALGNKQPLDADLTAIAALTGTSGFLKTNGAGTWSVDTATYLTSLGIGSSTQAWDADLDAIAALSGTSGLLKTTAANTWVLDTNTYLTSYTETDPIHTASSWYTTTNNSD